MALPSQRQLFGPSKEQLKRAQGFIDKCEWRFAKTMAHWPHWYVLREGHAREFDFVDRLITKFGYEDTWGRRTDRFLAVGEFKYWVLGNVLNRAEPISNVEVRERGKEWLREHGKEVGPGGRLVDARKSREEG
jgi:hypothetical protein